MTKADRIISQLFDLASDHERVYRAKIAAALVYKGKIISYGFNQERTHHLSRRFQKNEHSHWLHAEVDAVKNALKRHDAKVVSKSTLFVVRSKMNGKDGDDVFGNAKPCKGCQECIKWFGISKVYYSTDQGYEELND